MNKKEFKEALLRGRGCCIQAARTEPERYRDIVLWACRRVVAFDTQCEGSKAWFVYQLISCYEDRGPFLETLLAELEKTKSNGSWKMLYLAELLSHFASDGEKRAEAAIWRRYEALYHDLRARKRYPRRVFHELSDFDMLCEILAVNRQAMVRIAEDIGRLYRENPLYDGSNLDGPYCAWKRWAGTLKTLARKSEDIAAYLQAQAEEEARIQAFLADRPRQRTGRALSVWLKRQADDETVRAHAKAYREAAAPEARAEALSAFTNCPYPDDPAPVIADTGSDVEELSRTAWQALEQIRHPAVRAFALARLERDGEDALAVLLTNYESRDAEMLEKIVRAVPVDFACTTDWHGIQIDIINMEDRGLKAPAALLRYIYDTTYCSCCREYTLRQMGPRHLLTEEILEECLLDSNDNIRTYAARCLKRRKR